RNRSFSYYSKMDVQRKMRDNSVELRNLLTDWQECVAKGGKIMKSVADLRIQLLNRESSAQSIDFDVDRTLIEANTEAERLLVEIVPRLESIVAKARKVADSFDGIANLRPTTDCNNFAAQSRKVVEQFEAELTCKRLLIESIACGK